MYLHHQRQITLRSSIADPYPDPVFFVTRIQIGVKFIQDWFRMSGAAKNWTGYPLMVEDPVTATTKAVPDASSLEGSSSLPGVQGWGDRDTLGGRRGCQMHVIKLKDNRIKN